MYIHVCVCVCVCVCVYVFVSISVCVRAGVEYITTLAQVHLCICI